MTQSRHCKTCANAIEPWPAMPMCWPCYFELREVIHDELEVLE